MVSYPPPFHHFLVSLPQHPPQFRFDHARVGNLFHGLLSVSNQHLPHHLDGDGDDDEDYDDDYENDHDYADY